MRQLPKQAISIYNDNAILHNEPVSHFTQLHTLAPEPVYSPSAPDTAPKRSTSKQQKKDRLAKALKENLKRRKQVSKKAPAAQ
jgi:hypothetical protein